MMILLWMKKKIQCPPEQGQGKAPMRRISEKKKMTRKETENVIVEMAGGKISKLECKDLSLSVSQALEEVMAALNDVL